MIEVVTIDETDSGVQIDVDSTITAPVGLAQPEAEPVVTNSSANVAAEA